ncbi:MAG: Ger(x)C family spore germination protein [Dehalobacter sp. 4CP]|uniref:Ger(x)C family spore germination protein n=1 Tax=Dehalobacter sp. CP TaxID=2594474 RepID=UPI0013CA6C8E|nr:Ger(x)C family spore germination protein [Dehalobacter sp. 4CP]
MTSKAKRYARMILLMLSLLFLTGCWSRNEVEDLAMLTGGAIDYSSEKGQEKYEGQWVIIRPPSSSNSDGGASSSKSTDLVYKGEGEAETFMESVMDINKQLPRLQTSSHSVFFIYGENMAKEVTAKVTENFLRFPESRPNELLFVTKGNAGLFLQAKPVLVSNLFKQIKKQQEIALRTGVSRGVTYLEFCQWLLSPDRDPVLPQIKWNDVNQSDSIMIEGFGVFRSDKLVGWLDRDESKGYLLLTHDSKDSLMTFKFEYGSQIISYQMGVSKHKIKAKMVDGKPVFHILIQTFGTIPETANIQISTKNVKQMEAAAAESIREAMLKSISKARLYDSDFLGLMQHLHRHEPSAWKEVEADWRKAFREAEIEVEVQAKNVAEGDLKQSFNLKD